MSRAFIAEYFDYAKDHGNDPAVGFIQDKQIRWTPHWLIRSKAKHFALGLMELGAPNPGYFYLFPHPHPEWIFSLLAAQSLGLATVAIPPWMGIPMLEALMKKYPPSFIYGAQVPSEAHWSLFKKEKSNLIFILGGSDPSIPGEFISSFRKIHNHGIMVESKLYEQYRKRRESQSENQWLSPIQVNTMHHFEEPGLSSGELAEKIQILENRIRGKKTSQLFAQTDLSQTKDQIVSLYWPLSTGRMIILSQHPGHWLGHHPGYGPHIAYLSPEGVASLAHDLPLGKTPLLQKNLSFWGKRRARKKLGGNLQEIWSPASLGEETTSLFKKLGINFWTVEF
jgi:hypothetical protein